MFEIKNFDNWIEDTESGKFGSGASEKIWLINPENNQKGLFKFPKTKSNGTVTGEYWAEKLASELSNLLNIKCAKVDIGTYKGRIGSISYNVINNNETLSEGITFIQKSYPYYNRNKLADDFSEEKYSIQMIEKCDVNIDNILIMTIFDALIGNSDRHHSNWGYIYRMDKNKNFHSYFCPLYDNGSSLCSYEEDNAKNILKDNVRYNALLNTKSKSTIGWNNERPIRYFELIEKIKENYYENTIEFVKTIQNKINEISVRKIIDKFDDKIINKYMKQLLIRYILDRKEKIINIYNLIDR